MLHGRGFDVDFVGPFQTGTSSGDPDNAGYFGYLIDEVRDEIAMKQVVASSRPDYVFLLIGGNNMGNDKFASRAPADFKNLVLEIMNQAPRAGLVVSTLVQTATAEFNTRINRFNPQIKEIATELKRKGFPVSVVDLSKAINPKEDLMDGLHPNDQGYKKMAEAWYKYLQKRLPGAGARILQHNPHFQTTLAVPARSSEAGYIPMWNNKGIVVTLIDNEVDLNAVSPLSGRGGIATTFNVRPRVQVGVSFIFKDSAKTSHCPGTSQQLHVFSDVDRGGIFLNSTAGDARWRTAYYTFTSKEVAATLSFQAPGHVEGLCGPSIADVLVQQW